jgi:hypothetical protein
MSRFRAFEGGYDSAELAIFRQAYEDACGKRSRSDTER